jgi:NAD(P)-dependent dehydrogenase (short-subunit alcohol dehydrogenase family)
MQMLNGKYAVIFGAGGSIGVAVAQELALEGAHVFLAGRTGATVEKVAAQIVANGGHAEAAVVDAFDGDAVNEYFRGVVQQTSRIDIVFNAVGPLVAEYKNGTHAVDLEVAEFMVPLTTAVKSQFITARAASRQMVKQGSGVIIFLTGSPARGHVPGATAIGTAFGAIETLSENLAVEISPVGVRVVCLRTTANVDSRTIQQTMDTMASRMNVTKDEIVSRMASLNFLKVPAMTSDTAKAVAFLASDGARMITATVVNATAGAAAD